MLHDLAAMSVDVLMGVMSSVYCVDLFLFYVEFCHIICHADSGNVVSTAKPKVPAGSCRWVVG